MTTKLEIIKKDLPPFNRFIFEEIKHGNLRSRHGGVLLHDRCQPNYQILPKIKGKFW